MPTSLRSAVRVVVGPATRFVAALAAEESHAAPELDELHFGALSPELVLVTYRASAAGALSRHASLWDVSGERPVMRFHQGTVVATDIP